MVFDDRDEETRAREATYQIGPSKDESAAPRSEVLSSVFVRSRTPGGDHEEDIDEASSRETRQLAVALVIVALVLLLGWVFIR